MSKIIFNEETREFSVIESQEEFGIKDFGKNHQTALINTATTAVGSGAGAYMARRRAIINAKKAGATDAEAKAAGRKAAMKGAAVGAAAGLAAGVTGQAGVAKGKAMKNVFEGIKKGAYGDVNKDSGFFKKLHKSWDATKGVTRGHLATNYKPTFKKK